MNVNDFVILPGSKTGLSVKLKPKGIQELHLENSHLELENKEMEKKLQQLQENMSREKQERRRANGYHWKSGQAGLSLQPQLLSQNKANLVKAENHLHLSSGPVAETQWGESAAAAREELCGRHPPAKPPLCRLERKHQHPACCVPAEPASKPSPYPCLGPIRMISPGKVKLRILKEQDQVSEEAKQAVARKVVTDVISEKPKVKGKACGQCEIKSALLMCLECGEEYCPGCFARIHQKGALKLHRTTSLLAKSQVPGRILEAAQQFLKAVYPEEANSRINKEEKKKMNDQLDDRSNLSSHLSEVPMHNRQEASTGPSSEVISEIQNGGSLLQGSFDEEVSAKSFQKALNQWRSGNSSRKHKEERSCQVESEQPGTCQMQTSPPIVKKPIEIEFKEDSLTYMEKLLIKKHRRTPVDKLPDSVIEDELKLEKPLINEVQNTRIEKEEEEEEVLAITRFEAEEMKKYWTDALKKEPEVVTINSEPSLTIKILEDTFKEESEEAATFVLMEAGSDELVDYSGTMSKNEKSERDSFLAQAGNITTRSPLPSAVGSERCLTFLHNHPEESLRVRAPFSQSERADADCSYSGAKEIVPTNPEEGPITTTKWHETQKSNSHMSFEHFSPPKLAPSKTSPVMELSIDCKVPLELNESPPLTTKTSLVALREKPVCNSYRGLEGFFTMDTNCQQPVMDSFPSPRTGRHSPSSSISFSASELWAKHLSVSACADEHVIQDILKTELSRPSRRLGRKSPRHGALPSVFPRVQEAGSTYSAAWPLCQAASEISEIASIDVTEHDDPSWENSTDQQALADLGDELQSNSEPWENFSGVNSGDFRRHSKMSRQNLSDFHNNHETGDNSKGDTTIRVYDESHTDDEEDQSERQQVTELH